MPEINKECCTTTGEHWWNDEGRCKICDATKPIPEGEQDSVKVFRSCNNSIGQLTAKAERYEQTLRDIVNHGYTAEEIEEVKKVVIKALGGK